MNFANFLKKDDSYNILLKECSEYIKEARKSKNFLYRGVDKYIDNWVKITPRKDRVPKDTPQEIHKYVDDYLNKTFGWRGRSEGVFVDNYSAASIYGTPHIFLPSNGFKYIWSTEIYDLTIFCEEIRLIEKYGRKYEVIDDNWKDKLSEYMDTYTNSNLLRAINKSDNEIMFKCSHYYLVNPKYKERIFG